MLPVASSSDEPDNVQIVISTESGAAPAALQSEQRHQEANSADDLKCGSKIVSFISQRLRAILYLLAAGIVTVAIIHIDQVLGSNLAENTQVQDVLHTFLQLALGSKRLNTTAAPPTPSPPPQDGG